MRSSEKTTQEVIVLSLIVLLSLVFLSGCSATTKGTTTGNPVQEVEDTSASGAAAGAAGGALSSSGAGGTNALLELRGKSNLISHLIQSLFIPRALAGGLCPTYHSIAPTKCVASGGTMWLTLNECEYFDGTATWDAINTLISSSGSVTCGNFPNPGANGFLDRQFTSAASSTTPATGTVTSFFGLATTIDDFSSNLGNFNSDPISTVVNGGYGTKVTFDSTGARNLITIARHLDSTGSFDHSLSGSLNVTEVAGATSRTISGSIKVYHNYLRVIGTSTFNSVTHEDGCCYPTSGSISTVFNQGSVPPTSQGLGAVGKTETLTFNGCGRGVLNTYDGVTENVVLTRCF